MKVTKIHARLIGYTGLSALSYALIVLTLTYLFAIKRYELRVDDRIVPALNEQLATHVKSLPLGIRVWPEHKAQEIQKQFPWIKSVSFFRTPAQTMRVSVVIDEPVIKVNEAILTKSRVFPASTFTQTQIAALPTLSVHFPIATDRADIPPAFIPHAQTFATELFAPYSITWFDAYTARLTDKEQPNFVIQFNAQSIPDAKMFAHCATIKKLLQERGSFEGRKKQTRWIADIRFERQLILFSEDKGVTRG
jgi:hypothetical protein